MLFGAKEIVGYSIIGIVTGIVVLVVSKFDLKKGLVWGAFLFIAFLAVLGIGMSFLYFLLSRGNLEKILSCLQEIKDSGPLVFWLFVIVILLFLVDLSLYLLVIYLNK